MSQGVSIVIIRHLVPCLTLYIASDPNYHKYEHLLSPGWVPGRKIVC
jgi:hypothetical protein